MLKLTKKADYGLIALKHLAVNQARGSSSAKEIADCYGIPLPLLSKILQKLGKAGFLHSVQGTNGGYKLARDAGEITTLEVIRSIDGPIVLTACFTEHGFCSHSDRCNVREPLRKVHEGILRLLSSITIADMSQESTGNAAPANDAPGITELEPARLYGLAATPPTIMRNKSI